MPSAFTPKDAKNVKATAATFPHSEYVDVPKSLTSLGIGEALVSVLDPKGVPTAVAAAQVLAPSSRMSSIDDAQYQRVLAASPLAPKYATAINRDSAHEILQRKLDQTAATAEEEPATAEAWQNEEDDFAWRRGGAAKSRRAATPRAIAPPRTSSRRPRQSAVERTVQTVARQATRTVTQQIVRGIFGMLKGR